MRSNPKSGTAGENAMGKEGRYPIAHAHEVTMKRGFPFAHWLFMGLGGSETAAP